MTPSASEALTSASFPTRHILLLLLVTICLFFTALGRLPLLEPDEGRNAEVAREMLTSGDWITPHFNTLPYLDKPPVFFWLVAGSFRVAGVSEFAARLPSALMALATVCLTWFLARRMFGNAAGLRAGIILAASPLVIIFARLVIFDMTLTFLVTLAMVSFWGAQASDFRRPRLELLMFAAMGVATLTKGPVGFLLPLLSILAYQAVRRRFGELKRLRWGLGLAVFLAVTLSWFVAVSLRDPDFPRYALWEESLQRFATGQARRGGSLFYYVPVFLVGFFPWSLFALFAGWNRLKKWRTLAEEVRKPVVFLLVWAGVIFVFFTVSRSKLPGYFLPACVPLSILVARAWAEVENEAERRPPDWLTAGFASLIVLGLLMAFAPRLIRLAGVQIPALKKLDPTVVALLWPSLLYGGLILVALGVIGRNVASRMRPRTLAVAALALAAFGAPVLLVRWITPLKAYAVTSSSKRLAQTILASPERDLRLYGYYCFRTSLGFYLQRPVGLVTTDGSETTSNYIAARLPELRRRSTLARPWSYSGVDGDTTQDVQPASVLLDAQDLVALARHSPRPFLILVRNRDISKLSPVAARMEPLWSEWEYSVWKIRPRNTLEQNKPPRQAESQSGP